MTEQDRGPHRLAVFGFDAAEAAQRRRIRSWMQCGFDVVGFTMRRANMTHDAKPFWPNIDLGKTKNAAMGQRTWRILTALPKVWRNRAEMAQVETIVARNLDMLIIAAFARSLISPRPRLIYEALDIHDMMTNPGAKGRLARWIERRLLSLCSVLIVSSPAFQREYFERMQGWSGPVQLLENKLWFDDQIPPRPTHEPRVEDAPIVLGWVGTLRCPQSFEILLQTADKLGEQVQIAMHGIVHHHMLPDFDAQVAARPNVEWHGPYNYPSGLEGIYHACDAVWVQDLWQWGTNSTWLLPNRIYEASYFGCPSIAVAGTETGRRVENVLGWTLAEPSSEALVPLLQKLTTDDWTARRRAILDMPDTCFRQTPEEITAVVLP